MRLRKTALSYNLSKVLPALLFAVFFISLTLSPVLNNQSFRIGAQALRPIIDKNELNLDTSAVIQEGTFSKPQSIAVVIVTLPAEVNITPKEWYRGMFYYFQSERFNFKDIPFHFVLDRSGQVYNGIYGGAEHRIPLKNGPADPLLLAYLANPGDSDFSVDGKVGLQEMLVSLTNEHAIKPEKITVSNLTLRRDAESKVVDLVSEELFGSWKITFNAVIAEVNKFYKPTAKVYEVQVVNYTNPAGGVELGSEVILKLVLKNNSKYTIYGDDESQLLLTRTDGKDSSFFINNVWLSKTQLPLLAEDATIKPGAQETYEFKVKAPLLPGSSSEKFSIKNGYGQELANSAITITLNVDKGNNKVLEILRKDATFINVRKDPNLNSTVVGKASPGEKYIWTERNGNDWYKINYEGTQGWILGKYVKVI